MNVQIFYPPDDSLRNKPFKVRSFWNVTGLWGIRTNIIVMKWKDWVHVTKLDPDKQLKPGDIDAIAASGTDALMLSGTLNVTK